MHDRGDSMGIFECILQISASYNNVRYMWKVHWTRVVLNLQFDIYISITNIYNIALSIINSPTITIIL
jgi:hypothetical protein